MTIDTSREAVEWINEELSWNNSFGAIELINALLARAEAAETREQLAIRRKNSAETLLRTCRDAQKNVLNEWNAAKSERDAALADVERMRTGWRNAADNLSRLRDLLSGYDPDDYDDRPFCRDCADEDGRCPSSGLPCDPQEAAEELAVSLRADRVNLRAALAEVARLSTPPDDAETAELVAEMRQHIMLMPGVRGKTADALTRLSHAHAAAVKAQKRAEDWEQKALNELDAEKKLSDELAEHYRTVCNENYGITQTKNSRVLAAHAARRKE